MNVGQDRPDSAPSRAARLGLLLLSAATLVFEINLTRLFSVAQFYHFAFLIVSLALLGFGVSGAVLSIYPKWGRERPERNLSYLSLGASAGALGAYLLTNWLPFDSFSIAWEARQVGVLALHYVALSAPFFFAGMAVGLLLAGYPRLAGHLYAVNLVGSALGCAGALAAPVALGGEGTVILSSGLAALAALVAWPSRRAKSPGRSRKIGRRAALSLAVALLTFSLLDGGSRLAGRSPFSFLELTISPYKGLSYALQYPEARLVSREWNAFSRVDVVRSPGVRSLPGLSYRYPGSPPPELGLLVDGDDLSPVVLPEAELDFTAYMLPAVALQLRPGGHALILEPRGGLDVLVALTEGAGRVTAVEANQLIVRQAAHIYGRPQVQIEIETSRSYLRRSRETFDVIVFSLTSAYRPIRSGAYSLAEDYRYTQEAFQDALARLEPDGLLVVTRWLQVPPSEWLRAFALSVSALERAGLDPAERLVALRGYNLGLLLVRPTPFTPGELAEVRRFAQGRAFDLVYAPDIEPEEVNQFNVLEEPLYHQAFAGLLAAGSHQAWYASYPFDVSPPTDDHPFFGHFFKWSQAGQVLAELGKTWQPFGGAGYFVLLALLALALALAGVLILLPVAAARRGALAEAARSAAGRRSALGALAYFGLIGLGYLLVEIPLIQRFILFLGHPAYAFTAVLFAVLFFSGVGSQFSGRVPQRPALAALVLLILSTPWWLPPLFEAALGLPLAARLALSLLALAPVGFLMGVPFPSGVRALEIHASGLVPWVWGVNGSASVVSSALAALVALSFGFRWVLFLGAACYLGAALAAPALTARPRP